MQTIPSKLFKHILSTVVPALLIVATTIYVLAFKEEPKKALGYLPGKPLAGYSELYPVESDSQGHLYLDKARFVNAVEHFTRNTSVKAASDLIYLGQANNVALMLSDAEKNAYKNLIALPAYADLPAVDKQRDRILSGRRLGDSTTNFGLERIKNYSVVDKSASNFVSYGLTLKDGRPIKSSTIPLFDDVYGLVGFICMNIDISKLDQNHPEAVAAFMENFKAINQNQKIAELIENSKRKKM